MLVIRAYTVLDHLVVEVTCAGHGELGQPAHLVWRTTRTVDDLALAQVVAETCEALSECYRDREGWQDEQTDDCALV